MSILKLDIRGFSVIELAVVIVILGILATLMFPSMGIYKSRGRDVERLANIKEISAKFQDYSITNSMYPNNTNQSGTTSYCITDIYQWTDSAQALPDRYYEQLGGINALYKDPELATANIGLCGRAGSYLYTRMQTITGYSVVAARMELQTTGANYTNPIGLTNSGYIDELVTAQPLDKLGNDVDKFFILVTN